MKNDTPDTPDITTVDLAATEAQSLQLAKREHDQSLIALETLRRAVEGYSGRVLVRLPRSLHRRLTEAAAIEGVSLNQYILYKLSQ